jgi:hypothetical protein
MTQHSAGNTVALQENQLRAMQTLGPVLTSLHYHLAGGVGVALRHGHRQSVDLDYFRIQPAEDPSSVVRRLRADVPELIVIAQEPGTIQAQLFGVRVSLFDHASPLLAPPELVGETATRVAQAPDLMAMKLLAIQNRGDKKDFIDLFTLLTENGQTLGQALAHYQARYHGDLLAVARALVYFRDADKQPELLLIKPIEWSSVKAYFTQAVLDWERTRPKAL